MNVYDFAMMFLEPTMMEISVFDVDFPDMGIIYSGYLEDMPTNIKQMEIVSIDNPTREDCITVNAESI